MIFKSVGSDIELSIGSEYNKLVGIVPFTLRNEVDLAVSSRLLPDLRKVKLDINLDEKYANERT